MKTKFLTLILTVAAGIASVAPQANAASGDSTTFSLKVSAGAAACLSTSGSATST